MKKYLLLLFIIQMSYVSQGQDQSGKVIVDRLFSKSLENSGGEDPTRRVTIYLPPGYDETKRKYPVIYFLHGFTISDSLQITWFDYLQNI